MKRETRIVEERLRYALSKKCYLIETRSIECAIGAFAFSMIYKMKKILFFSSDKLLLLTYFDKKK